MVEMGDRDFQVELAAQLHRHVQQGDRIQPPGHRDHELGTAVRQQCVADMVEQFLPAPAHQNLANSWLNILPRRPASRQPIPMCSYSSFRILARWPGEFISPVWAMSTFGA